MICEVWKIRFCKLLKEFFKAVAANQQYSSNFLRPLLWSSLARSAYFEQQKFATSTRSSEIEFV